MRRAAKVDKSQALIVAALRAAGAFVYPIGRPVDLLVKYRDPETFQWLWTPMECKTPGYEKNHLKERKEQGEFIELHDIPVVTTPSEALRAIGVGTKIRDSSVLRE